MISVLVLLSAAFALVARTPATGNPTLSIASTLPRIGVRVANGVGEFYNTATGEEFIPRGNNYIRLAYQSSPCDGVLFHSNFDPGLYNSTQAEKALERMRNDGYNVVRVFMNGCRIGDAGTGLSSYYLVNVVDFLRRAQANGIYVLITGDLPNNGVFDSLLNSACCTDFASYNLLFLTPGGLEANRLFWQDFVQGLIDLGAPMDDVFAFELWNEAFFEADAPPLNLSSGIVTTVNGQSYNMSQPGDQQRMMDENLVYWIDSLRASILQVEPQALVTIGFFVPQQPNPAREGDPRVIRTYYAIANPEDGGSTADFIDLHPYPSNPGLTLPQYVENFEIGNSTRKPILMGEFGAFRSDYPFIDDAAQVLQNWQVTSCAFRFVGWLLWTWDGYEQPDLWNALSDSEVINRALSPADRPDACTPGAFPGQNLALGKPTIASLSLPSYPASMAVDGSSDTWWGSGDFPPQWIEIDLQAPSTVGGVRLIASQSPAGETLHDVWGRGPGSNEAYQLLHEFHGDTTDGEVLVDTPPTPWTNLQFVRVSTMVSPSWVSWREIQVLRATAPGEPENLEAAAGDARTVLSWAPSPSDGGTAITGYLIYRGDSSSGESLLADVGNVRSYTDTGPANGATYFYQVSAVNVVGEGRKSVEVSATPVPLVLSVSANPTSGVAPLAVSFTSTVSGGHGPYAYGWAFGDGATLATASANHTYTTAGEYTVILNIADAQGTATRQTLHISVTAPAPPAAEPIPPGNEPAPGGNGVAAWALSGAAAGAAAVAVLGVWLRRRKKKGG